MKSDKSKNLAIAVEKFLIEYDYSQKPINSISFQEGVDLHFPNHNQDHVFNTFKEILGKFKRGNDGENKDNLAIKNQQIECLNTENEKIKSYYLEKFEIQNQQIQNQKNTTRNSPTIYKLTSTIKNQPTTTTHQSTTTIQQENLLTGELRKEIESVYSILIKERDEISKDFNVSLASSLVNLVKLAKNEFKNTIKIQLTCSGVVDKEKVRFLLLKHGPYFNFSENYIASYNW
ncbi:hypothetical protein ACTFIY_004980 [Dictyostelium cf. discoideum]